MKFHYGMVKSVPLQYHLTDKTPTIKYYDTKTVT